MELLDRKFCPLYNGEITEYGCEEISFGAKNGYLVKDGLPPLVAIEEIKKKRDICLKCQGLDVVEIQTIINGFVPCGEATIPSKAEKKMSKEEIKKRLAGRALEYLMFKDD